RPLQHWRMVAQLGRLAQRLVDDRVERDDLSQELAPDRLRVRKVWSRERQCAVKPSCNFSGNGGEQRGHPTPGAAEISSRKYDAGADDADADFTGAEHRENEGLPVRAAGGTE